MAKQKQGSKKAGAIPLPPGFRQTNRGNFPPVFAFNKVGTVLQGIVQGIKDVPKGKNVDKDTRIMYVANDSTGEVNAVWQSAALTDLFDSAKKGDEVFIRYDGEVKVKGRRQPMHGFTAGIKETGKRGKKAA